MDGKGKKRAELKETREKLTKIEDTTKGKEEKGMKFEEIDKKAKLKEK